MKLTSTQNRQRKAHTIVLVRREKEHAISHDAPDGDISQDPCGQTVRVDSRSTAPVERDEIPRQRTADDGHVDEPRRPRVPEVRRRQVEEIDDQQSLGDPEVAAHPEHDEAEEQQVAGDEV